MSGPDDFDRSLARWFESEARPTATADVLDRALRAIRRRRPRPRLFAALGSDWVGDSVGSTSSAVTFERTRERASMAVLLVLLALVLVAAAVLVGAGRLQPAPVDLGIFEPIAGRIVYGDEQGIWGFDPAAPADPATRIPLTSEAGIPLGWSSDGTRLLIRRGSSPEAHLFVLHADGSEMQVTERPMSIAGATISPDGSRVVFAGGEGTLYAVDADGGPAERLLGPGEHMVQQPTYSPDGMRIAYSTGGGDHSNSVWLMDADGSNAQQVVSNETTAAAGHVRGLAWSPTGDRIALGIEGTIYAFAADGSDFTQIAGGETTCDRADPCAVKAPKSAESPYWSPDGSQIAYTTGCVDGAGAANRAGCILAIADADGSNVREFGVAASGPWHPAPITSDEPPPAPSAAGEPELQLQAWGPGVNPSFVEVAVYADGRVIWDAGDQRGYVEKRLTPEGVEQLRSRTMSTGLFERELAIGIDDVGWGNIKVRSGDLSVMVAWGRTSQHVSGLGLEGRFVAATSTQAVDVTELEAYLSDPTTWDLPDDAYVQQEITPFVPSHFWVGFDRGVPNLSNLPSPAREVVAGILEPLFLGRCQNISIDQARDIAQVLERAGIIPPDYDVRLGFAFDLPSPPSFVHVHPVLPHDVGTVCGQA